MRCIARGLIAAILVTGCSEKPPTAPDPTYTVGGTVTGLEGSGLMLKNAPNDVVSADNGPFQFDAEYADAAVYSVSVSVQPSNPTQTCTVENGFGVIDGDDIDNIEVTCVTPSDNDDLDPTFDEDGRLVTDLITGAHDMHVMADGRIVVINEFDVVRLNADGSPDATFSGDGRVSIDFPGTADRLRAVAVQPDGRIIVAGLSWTGNIANAALTRLNPDGSVDGSFGTAGAVMTNGIGSGAEPFDLVVQPDGFIVAGGVSVDAAADGDFTVFRFTPAGETDTTFNAGNPARVDMGGRVEIGHAIALQPDGRIVIAGRVADTGGADPNVGVARFNSDGTIDTSFGVGGMSGTNTPAFWDEAADVVVQQDGRIVIAGHLDTQPARFLVMRLEPNGTLDATFGSNGYAEDAHFSDENDYATALALLPDGRIVAVGQKANYGQPDMAVARFNADGSLDTSFGTGGLSAIDFLGGADAARAIAVLPDGAILIAGIAYEGPLSRLALAKLKP